MSKRDPSPVRSCSSCPDTHQGAALLVAESATGFADVEAACARACSELASSGAPVLVCDVAAVTEADAGTIDALGRLQLTARRLGGELRLRHARPELRELLDLTGLAGTLPLEVESF